LVVVGAEERYVRVDSPITIHKVYITSESVFGEDLSRQDYYQFALEIIGTEGVFGVSE
jgi:hypothetical protein